MLVSFLYFRTTAKLDVTKITKTTGVRSNALEFVGLLIYRFLRFDPGSQIPVPHFQSTNPSNDVIFEIMVPG